MKTFAVTLHYDSHDNITVALAEAADCHDVIKKFFPEILSLVERYKDDDYEYAYRSHVHDNGTTTVSVSLGTIMCDNISLEDRRGSNSNTLYDELLPSVKKLLVDSGCAYYGRVGAYNSLVVSELYVLK